MSARAWIGLLLILFILGVFYLTARLMWTDVRCLPFESGSCT
jgi:hypothetical protein